MMLSLLLTSCTKDFEEINTDPNNTPAALPNQLLAPALVNTMQYNLIRNRNLNNELMQVTVDLGDNEGKVFRYELRTTLADYLYNGWYSQLTNFKDIAISASLPVNYNESYIGISLVCQSWIYSMLTDTYGDVPYFKSNLGRDSLIMEPPFDRQKDIYLDIFEKLDSANTLLATNAAIVGKSDPVFGGDVTKWRRFCNSLYLRLLMRVSGKAEVADFCQSKIHEIVEGNPAKYPIMTSNDHSAILRWTGVAPITSPLMTVREQDFRAVAIGAFFIDNLVLWNDPRIDRINYGTGAPTVTNRWAIAPVDGIYEGVPSGYLPGSNVQRRSYFYSNTHNSSTGPSLMNEPLTGMIMNYAELQFLLAEAAVKGWISNNTAESYYREGVRNSITLWLPNWNMDLDTYLNQADLQWVENFTLDQKMELIHLQKYYALFLVDLQQWFEYRRTGHPTLPDGPGLANGGVMPARLNYPNYVQSTNPTNYRKAVEAQGPDVISTQVWWQKP